MHTYSYRQIAMIAWPILVSTLMEQLIGMTDTAFLGRVGTIELGASALGGIFYVAVFMVGLGFSIGAQILMARRNGQGDYAAIGHTFYHSLALLTLLACLVFVLTRWLAPSILESIISSHAVYEAANSYLQWRIFGLLFAFVNALFRAFYVATTHTRTLTLNSIALVLSNMLFNYALIFGHFGMPQLGIAGAAIGSTLAEVVSLTFFVVYTGRHVNLHQYALDKLPRISLTQMRRLLSLGSPVMLQNVLSLSTWFLFFLSVEHLGERQLAATNIIRNISSFTFMTVIALSSTATTLVSNLMGAGEHDAVWPMLRRVIGLGYLILVPVLLLIGLFPDSVMHLFTADHSLVEIGRTALYVLLSSYLFTIPTQILLHAVSGTGNTRTALLFESISLSIYCVYVGVAIFGCRVSLPWCWFSEYVYHIFTFILCSAYMGSARWRNKRI